MFQYDATPATLLVDILADFKLDVFCKFDTNIWGKVVIVFLFLTYRSIMFFSIYVSSITMWAKIKLI